MTNISQMNLFQKAYLESSYVPDPYRDVANHLSIVSDAQLRHQDSHVFGVESGGLPLGDLEVSGVSNRTCTFLICFR